MVTLTAAVGYFMASRQGFHTAGFFHILVGTFLVAGAANTLNQLLERTPDARMRRTAERPLPTGRVSPEAAGWFAAILGIVGTGYTAFFLNPLTAIIAVATLGSYAFVYTPLKRQTPWNTLVGAVPGALPPLGGWAAATGGIGLGGWVLFGVVFLWQIPHFLSIAWLLRQDYARAGFRMLPVVDPEGTRTARHLLVTGGLLVPVSLVPAFIGLAGTVYLAGALALSLLYLGVTIRLARRPETLTARAVFLVSLVYLPALLAIMMIDKLPV
jgi:protoheme IX farnesyltransferase